MPERRRAGAAATLFRGAGVPSPVVSSSAHDAELTAASLRMAATTRAGRLDGVIFHSDRGSEYTAAVYADTCARLRVVQSMGRVASALDNAAAEAVNSILKTEFIYRHAFPTREQARLAIGRWIDGFYNARRRHGWCGGISPIDYEHRQEINNAGWWVR